MLFNSPVYIFLFLPTTFVVYFLLCRRGLVIAGTAWLVCASLFFYQYWNPAYLILILSTLLVNYALGTALCQIGRKDARQGRNRITKKTVLVFGIFFNVALLCYFKYMDFALATINRLFGVSFPLPHLLLPLGISFFTFQKIAFLVDCNKERAEEYNFLHYCLFISFFPQLIAGPIVHHSEVIPQFIRLRNRVFDFRNIAKGIFLFTIGLFKKVYIADQFSVWAQQGFNSSAALSFFDAWGTSLSYTFQLYFDFSGYSDMAIGAALLFNIRLPINFDSPYKSKNIRDFWRRWHITLSRWLRDYIYIPLGGNRGGLLRGAINIFLTFLLGGLWHGAGWTFVFWGALHGGALVMNRFWERAGLRMPGWAGWLVTFLFVNAAWVFFRAETFTGALIILKGMAGLNGILLPSEILSLISWPEVIRGKLMGLQGNGLLLPLKCLWYLGAFGIVALFFPNSGEISGFVPMRSLLTDGESQKNCASWRVGLLRWLQGALFRFQPSVYWAVLTAAMLSAALYRLLRVAPSEFLYFNF
ncbi:MAG: hypothetical protein BWK76_18390 [Desulfobulbaceae bacterium A2]|nr:MAG: hypothetical protein BWK76_18390 [Desulfobulbaceae bacterium A2]